MTPWVLSAESAPALAARAARLVQFIEQRHDLDPTDIAYSLTATRTSFGHRAVVVGADRDELLQGLRAIASGASSPLVITGRASAAGGTVFVFPGFGTQWTGMATELVATAPAFAHQMRLCDEVFADFVDWSLLDVMHAGGSPLDRVDVLQPVLFAVMVSLAAQWGALGLQPDAVLGHSHGEIAAAYVAGALSLRACRKGRHVAQQGDQGCRGAERHGFDRVPDRTGAHAHQTQGPVDLRRGAQRSAVDIGVRAHGGPGRVDGRL